MVYDLKAMAETMQKYFKECNAGASETGKRRSERILASEAGLCIALGIGKDELRAMEQGTEEERRFFNRFKLEYEVAIDIAHNAGLVTDTVYKDIKTALGQVGTSDDKTIVLEFTEFNAPDDWEDYKALLAVLDENGLTWKQGAAIIRKTVGGDKA